MTEDPHDVTNVATGPTPDLVSSLNEYRVCRICLEKDDKAKLIAPCKCKGSIKYVHARCIASWRISLARSGRHKELYHCTLCKQRLTVRQKRKWTALLNNRVIRGLVTLLILIALLIPAGTLMKTLIHFSVHVAYQPGGLPGVWSAGTLTEFLISSTQNSLRRSLQPTTTMTDGSSSSSMHVLYTPFPICFRNPESSTHSLISSRFLYYFLFPLADERLWQLILCRLEHFHLGFFLLGSINNIWFTYRILNDMFDIVLAVQQHDNRQLAGDEDGNQEHDIVQAAAVVAAAAQNDARLDGITRRLGKLVKGFLLTYCCSLVVLFWIHFNLFAFHVDGRVENTNDSREMYSSKQFLAELPLWTLRWVTLGVAVADFAVRGVYGWLTQMTSCIEDEEVVSLPENMT